MKRSMFSQNNFQSIIRKTLIHSTKCQGSVNNGGFTKKSSADFLKVIGFYNRLGMIKI